VLTPLDISLPDLNAEQRKNVDSIVAAIRESDLRHVVCSAAGAPKCRAGGHLPHGPRVAGSDRQNDANSADAPANARFSRRPWSAAPVSPSGRLGGFNVGRAVDVLASAGRCRAT
jgi:hypothetical protein